MNKSILIVNKNPLALKLLTLTLESAGFYVYTSPNSQHALVHIQSVSTDAILFDVQGSLQEGLAAHQALRLHPKAAQIPIVMLSNCQHANGNEVVITDAATKHLYKPISRRVLVEQITQLTSVQLSYFE